MTIFLTPLIVMMRAVQLGAQQWLIRRLQASVVISRVRLEGFSRQR